MVIEIGHFGEYFEIIFIKGHRLVNSLPDSDEGEVKKWI